MKIAYIGVSGHCGYAIEPHKSHPEWLLAGIAPGSAEENVIGIYNGFADTHPDRRLYSNWRELLENETPDIVVNSAITGYAAEITAECLRRGISVFAEKPMAVSLAELDMIEAAWREGGAHLTAMLPYRYDGAFCAALKAVREGKIGEVRLINAQKSYKLGTRPAYYSDRALYGGTVPWVGSHAFDWVRFFSGAHYESVSAFHTSDCNGGNGTCEASAVCTAKLSGNVLATVTIDYLRPQSSPTHADDRVRVMGTKGYIDVKDGVAVISGEESGVLPLDPSDVPENIFTDFVAEVEGTGKCRLSAEEAFETVRAAIAARDSADTCQPISLL